MSSSAQAIVEYGLLIATVAILVLLGMGTFGAILNDWFARIMTSLPR